MMYSPICLQPLTADERLRLKADRRTADAFRVQEPHGPRESLQAVVEVHGRDHRGFCPDRPPRHPCTCRVMSRSAVPSTLIFIA